MTRQLFLKLSATVITSSSLAAWWYRPVPDRKDGLGIARIGWISHYNYHNANCIAPPLPFQFASSAITLLVVSVSWIFLYAGGSFRIIEDENYRRFLEIMKNRDPEVPVFTVSNHRSLLDDPLLLSALLPFWMNCQPKYLRWGACAQEICFKETDFAAAFFGAGKSLPMWRGGGVDQPLLLQLARKAVGSDVGQRADWIHVYPEAGVYQWKYDLGGRRIGRDEIGKLKWGVGKLIAHHPTNRTRHSPSHNNPTDPSSSKVKAPIVIPFYFIGSESITPFDDPLNRKVTTRIPQIGHKIVLRFGEPIVFGDLLDEFETDEVKSGHVDEAKKAIRVYTCCDNPSSSHHRHGHANISTFSRVFVMSWDRLLGHNLNENPSPTTSLAETNAEETTQILSRNEHRNRLLMSDLESWKSTEREKKLYHQITSRIEVKLEELGKRCAEDFN